MEDAQPNERRLSRKGSTTIPPVRTVHAPYRPGWRPPRPPKRPNDTRSLSIHASRNSESIHKETQSRVKIAQSHEPRPGRRNPTPRSVAGLGHYSQHPARRPSLYRSVQRNSIESSTTEPNSYQLKPVHNIPAPPRRPSIHIMSSAERVVDISPDPPSPAARQEIRWSNFRSGQVDICLPPSSCDSSALPLGTNPQLDIQRGHTQANRQPANAPVLPNSDTVMHSVRQVPCTNVTVPMRPVVELPIRRSLSDQFRQDNVVEATRSSYCNDYLAASVDGTRSFPDHSANTRDLTFTCGIFPLPLGPHDKPRRVLHSDDSAYVVTAHGTIDQINAANMLQLDHHIRSPHLPLEEFVHDACILSYQRDTLIILGHAREQNQITFLNLGHNQASQHVELCRSWNAAKRPGVSAVASLSFPLKFVSGGYDHRVHVWDVAQDLSGASARELSIKHTSMVHSLLPIVDTSHKLVSVGADRDVPVYDISVERVVRTLKVSSMPFHAHKTEFPSCTLLEVAHLETQFEVCDLRFSQRIVQRFGFITEERRGRFEKADAWSSFVACGDKNGTVHLWDLRNVSREIALQPCFRDPVIQVVNTGPRLLACSKRNELASLDLSVGR